MGDWVMIAAVPMSLDKNAGKAIEVYRLCAEGRVDSLGYDIFRLRRVPQDCAPCATIAPHKHLAAVSTSSRVKVRASIGVNPDPVCLCWGR